jgi:hypothetical protein
MPVSADQFMSDGRLCAFNGQKRRQRLTQGCVSGLERVFAESPGGDPKSLTRRRRASIGICERLDQTEKLSFPTVPVIVRDRQAPGDTGERVMLRDLVGKQTFQQLPDGNNL